MTNSFVKYAKLDRVSFLSPYAAMLIKEATLCTGDAHFGEIVDIISYLDDALNGFKLKDFQETVLQNDGYQKILRQFSKSVCCISNYFQRCIIFNSNWKTFLHWTRNEQLFSHVFTLLQKSDDATSVSIAVLLCTAALERALGNVYMMFSVKIPSLMKELLASQELYGVFGEKIHLLQIVMGSPLSLNIRNILWHGFAAPQEVPVQLGHFLFSMVMDLGNILIKKGIGLDILPIRQTVDVDLIFKMQGVFPDLCFGPYIEIVEKLFQESSFIPSVMLAFWQTGLRKLQEQKYAECVALILPQIEHSLRCLFAFVNDCPERVLTAESTSYYTTLDEIFAPQLADGNPNKLMTSLRPEFIVSLQDILIYPDGPRIRDHFSHGEFDFYAIPHIFANHLLCLAVAFCAETLPGDHLLKKFQPIQSICSSMYTYEPKFHPSTNVKELIANLLDSFGSWPTCNYESALAEVDIMSFSSTFKVVVCNEPNDFKVTILRLLHEDQFNDAVLQMKCSLKKFRCQVLHRPQCEWKVLMQLCRILGKAHVTSVQIIREVQEKTRKLQGKELHSRQRITYQTMLSNMFYLKMCLCLSAVIASVFLFHVNVLSTFSPKDQNLKQKFLKMFEKYVDNLKSVTCPNKNHWQKSRELGEQFLVAVEKHLENGFS